VITAMSQDPPPRRLVLGNSGYDAVVETLEKDLAEIRRNEDLSRSADFPA
ncbi:short-chain dehydrogenase/reductase, partial [Pseudonocardia sp. EV170527-09]